MELVFYFDGKIYLDSRMNQDAFSKTRFSEQLGIKGVLAEYDCDSWNFKDWTWSGTRSSLEIDSTKSETVLFEGNFVNGKTLFQAEGIEKEQMNLAVIQMLSSAIQQNIKIPNQGGEGIFVSSDCKKILFIPNKYFVTAAQCAGKELSAKMNDVYINPMLKGNDALYFLQGSLAYETVTKKLPYSEINERLRSEDLLDKKYFPLSPLYPKLDSVASSIDEELSIDIKFSKLDSEQKKIELNFDALKKYIEENPDRETEYTLKYDQICSKKFKAIERTRFFRHNKIKLGIAGGVLAASLFVFWCFWSASLSKPTTKGLSAKEVVESYVTAINKMDVQQAEYTSTKNLNNRNNVLSNLYVTSKMRSMYDPKVDVRPPAQWLCYNQLLFNIYGVTQFTIDGEQGEIFFIPPEKKDKSKAITEENGAIQKFNVHYYTINTSGLDELIIIEETAVFETEFIKNKWLVNNIFSEQKEETISREQFIKDYTAALNSAENNLEKTAQILRKKYYWISTDDELKSAAENMKDLF